MINKFVVLGLLLTLLLVSSNVFALGISPGRIVIDFEPNLQKTLTYDVINNGGSAIDVEMYVKGDLAQYITLSQNASTLSPGERKTFTYTVSLPGRIDVPGMHDNRIGAVESIPTTTSTGGAQVSARVAVESQIQIKVPYEGLYSTVSLKAPESVKTGEPVNFEVDVDNVGTIDFTATGKIDIFSATDNTMIATVATSTLSIPHTTSGKLTATWDTKNVQPGPYKAVATVFFGGLNQTSVASFNVGGLIVKILDISHGVIKKDAISKFTIKVESLWNEEIKGVYANLLFYAKTSQQIANVKSDMVDITANGQAELNAFWDTTGLDAGKYNVKAVVNYANKTSETTFDVEIESGFGIPVWVIIIIVVIAVAGVVVMLIIKSNTKSKHKRR